MTYTVSGGTLNPTHSLTGYYLDGLRVQTGKLSWYVANIKDNSAFHYCGVGKLSTGLSGCR